MNKVKEINKKWFRVDNPSDEVLAYAKTLTQGKWAAIRCGHIVIHKNFKSQLDTIIRKASRVRDIVVLDMSIMSKQQVSDWAWKNLNKAEAAEALVDAYSHKQASRWSKETYEMLQNGVTIAKLEEWLI